MSKTDKELILEVTQEEYDEAMKKGWNDDDIQKPGKHRYHRTTRVAKPSEAKVKITMWLDGDVLLHFQKRAAPPHAAPYQTQINAELRKTMEQDLSDETAKIGKNIETLTTNKEFIRAVAEQLKELETV
ncbi:MAG: BrnA antitoxin family protein [Pyrinomonadaceae bacterium]|nr:BrnA antitoxin family protein [Pyrinomonadaceae bacterium]